MSHNRALPVSVINHNTVIPKNNERYHETFNTVIMPRDLVYKITSITCKIDTTSLWNIRAMNVVKVQMLSGFEMVYNVGPGYYSITELCRAIADSIQIDDVNRAYLNSEVATAVDLSGAPDYTSILKLEGVVTDSTIATEPYDITNGMSVIRVYSSINAQTFGLKSPLIDNLIHVSMGLSINAQTFGLKSPLIDNLPDSCIDGTEQHDHLGRLGNRCDRTIEPGLH